GFGLPPAREAIARALQNVHLDAGLAIEFQIGPQSREAPFHLAALLQEQGLAPGCIDARLGFDPIGAAAVWGGSPYSWNEIAPTFAGAVMKAAALGFKGPMAVADGRIVHDAGGSEVQELAFALAVGVAYLRALEAAGLPLEQARETIYARLSADADQFLTI